MYIVTFKKKIENETIEQGYENFLTDTFLSDVVKDLLKREYNDISIEKI